MNQQHRLWNVSPWWTRFGAIIGLISIIYGVWMSLDLARNVGSCNLPHHLKHPGLAIEVAHDWHDAAQVVGVCEGGRCLQDSRDSWCTYNSVGQSKIVCEAKINALARQQKMDYIFIILYALFFIYIGIINIRFARISAKLTGWKSWLIKISPVIGITGGLAVLMFALLAAFWDWRENNRILQALSQLSNHICYGDNFPDIRTAAYYKWRYLFIAIGCGSSIFFFWPGLTPNWQSQGRRSVLSFALAWLTALTSLTTAFTGILACRYGQDQRLETATGTLFLTLLLAVLTLAYGQHWYGSTLDSLNKFASLKFIRPFALFLKDKEEQVEEEEGPEPIVRSPRS